MAFLKKKKPFILWIFLFVVLQLIACSTTPHITVEALPQYDALFANRKGWSGGDGAYSVALAPDILAWFFGDTWIGRAQNDRHANAALVNNTVAIQQGKAAATAKMRFYYGRGAGNQPAALIHPDDERGWFWIFDGVATPEGLYIFLIQTVRTPGDEPFGFRVVGNWLGHVADPRGSPLHWHIKQSKVAGSTFSATGGMLWGSAVLEIDEVLYIYGTAEEDSGNGLRKHMILARVAVSALGDFSQWRYYADGSWVSDSSSASRLSANMPYEYSVTYLPALRQFVAVYSEDGLSQNILVRLSPKPEGPWSDPILIFQCPEAEWDDSIFCYAAKAHASLSESPDELIVTYIANSVDFNRVANDNRLYRPRFLRVIFHKR